MLLKQCWRSCKHFKVAHIKYPTEAATVDVGEIEQSENENQEESCTEVTLQCGFMQLETDQLI